MEEKWKDLETVIDLAEQLGDRGVYIYVHVIPVSGKVRVSVDGLWLRAPDAIKELRRKLRPEPPTMDELHDAWSSGDDLRLKELMWQYEMSKNS